MFTGIITDIGEIVECSGDTERMYSIACSYAPETIELGASISCNGCCLTVAEIQEQENGAIFSVTASSETLEKTTLGSWVNGTRINLERSLKHGDELGGHIVSGHIDGIARIFSKDRDADSMKYSFEAPEELMKYIAPKGSIALNGTSLTVNHVEGCIFDVMLIPHTLQTTIWGMEDITEPGTGVNLEIDMLARYAEKLIQNNKK